MGSARVSALLFGLCAFTALPTIAMASGTADSIALLQQPDIKVQMDVPLRQPAPSATPEITVPVLPDVTVTLPAAAPASPDVTVALPETPAALHDLGVVQNANSLDKLALPPEAPIALTATDRMISALAVRLADVETGKGLSLSSRLPKDVRQAITQYYRDNAFRPVWIGNDTWTPAAQMVLAQLKRASEDGLDAGEYALPNLSTQASQDELVQAELSLSAAAVLYARDARGGRINPGRLSKNITPQMDLPKAENVLADLAGSRDAGHALSGYNPQHPGYLALRKKLAETRASEPAPLPDVTRGPVLKLGMTDARVPVLRQRLGITVAEGEADVYDAALAAAVATFQKSHGQRATGQLTDQTVAALSQNSDSPKRMQADLIANMERWRWLPSDMGERYVQVNVPEYELRFVSEGSVVREARVIVGKAGSPTPIFSGSMQTVVVNPYWNIPPSILKNEVLPGLASDPDYASRRGYQVTRSRNGNISVRQPPGERNALGLIKFLFPNQHSVYLHDTPNRGLFSAEKRAFSHGCVRLEQPFQFAEAVLGEDWPQQKVRNLVGKGERNIKLDTPIPVHLTYFTLEIDNDGNLRRFDDIYGFNKQVRDALGLKG